MREWIDGGLTNPNSVTLLCVYHHHNFLVRGLTCGINTDGIPEWTPPIWVDRDQKPMINTRIQAVLTARKHAQWNKPIISWPSVVDRAQIPCRIAYTRAQS